MACTFVNPFRERKYVKHSLEQGAFSLGLCAAASYRPVKFCGVLWKDRYVYCFNYLLAYCI